MQIKHNYLAQQLQKKLSPIYWLAGQDTYLLEDSSTAIKKQIKSRYDCDEKIMTIQSVDDWRTVIEEANSYSLFSETTLLTIYYDKKSLESSGKKIINDYLNNINSRCFIIIRTPNITAKQLQWLIPLNDILFIIHYSLNKEAMTQWIVAQLQKNSFTFDVSLPALINQYTQGNMLACAQVIEKLSLSYSPNAHISVQQGLEQVFNQCEHNLFELIDACLLGQADKSIQILRYAAHNKTESILVLWMLTQEIRLLIQLQYCIKQNMDIKTACSQLKIWPQKSTLYQSAAKRINYETLQHLLNYCLIIDEQIKSNLNNQMWNSLEKIALSVCLGAKNLCYIDTTYVSH